MRSLEEIKALVKKGYTESKAVEDAVKANPTLMDTPAIKKRYRGYGVLMVVLGLGITFTNYMTWQSTERVLIIAAAANIVFVLGGLWMIITGKNPFIRKTK